MNDYSHMLSKGALLLKGLGLGEEVEMEITTYVSESFLSAFQDIAKLLITERLPVSIGVPLCHYILEKGLEDPKNKSEFDKEPLKQLVEKGARDFEAIMASHTVSNKVKLLINDILVKIHLPAFIVKAVVKE